MRQGFVIPGGSPSEQLELAQVAEDAGWDGVFVSETGYAVDPWALLSAVAVSTERVRLGTMLTPLPWRRPWKLAAQVATLDHLSGGRAILAVGLGAVDDALGDFGEPTDRSARAALLDEGLDIITGLWAGKRAFEGAHHRVDLTRATAMGDPLQPAHRIPIWCVGAWPAGPSLRRILRTDGLLPARVTDEGARQATPDELTEMVAWLAEQGKPTADLDVVVEGETNPGDRAPLTLWRDAGAT